MYSGILKENNYGTAAFSGRCEG